MMVYNLEILYIKKIKEDIVVNFLLFSFFNLLKKKRFVLKMQKNIFILQLKYVKYLLLNDIVYMVNFVKCYFYFFLFVKLFFIRDDLSK